MSTKRKPVTTVDHAGLPELLDTGCEFSATCAGCPWRECYHLMSPADRRVFRLAYRVLESFKAPPDRTLDAAGRPALGDRL